MSFLQLQAQNFALYGAGASVGDTSLILKSFKDINGVNITMADLGSVAYVTLEPGNGNLEEQISFTGVTQNANSTATLTGVKTVLFKSPYTETSGIAKTHAGSTTAILSNTAGYYQQFVHLANTETITGKKTFPNDDVSNAGIATDTDTAVATNFITLGQLSRQAISGASNAATTVKGIVQLPTQAQVDAKTTTGSTGALLALTPDKQRSTLLSDYVADTGSANAYAIAPSPTVSALTAGQRFSFKVKTTNTTTSTLAVNALAGTMILKQDNATALGAGDLLAGQIVEVEYNGVNGFQLMTPSASLTLPGLIQMYGGSAAPSGWLLCDGSSYLRSDYPSLFSVLSTTYGNADGSHFNVPDLRGRVPIGVGTGTGGGAAGTGLPTGGSALTIVARAGWKGEETHTLTTPEIAAHTHTYWNATGSGGSPNPGGGSSTADNGGTTSSTGGNGAHNNIQPVMGVQFIIKT